MAAGAKAQRSLKSRALQLLAQRDQSRLELKRKLMRHAQRVAAGDASEDVSTAAGGESEVEALLDWLEANRFLCDERFVDARVHARENRFGNLRIRSELAQHGVALPIEQARALEATELARAAAVRERRFAFPPCDAAERAAQSRFLAGRGFSPDVVHRLMRQLREGSRAADPDRQAAD